MNILSRVARWWLADQLTERPSLASTMGSELRSRPLQGLEARTYPSGTVLDVARYVATFAVNGWVNTGVSRMSSLTAATPLQVVAHRNTVQTNPDHPILALLGEFGQPNDGFSAFEFWENHYTYFLLTGNAFWYWVSRAGTTVPDEVHLLNPAQVKIVPGSDRYVACYEYQVMGQTVKLSPFQVTHFRRPNPFSAYWGLPALEAIMVQVLTDLGQANWNKELFGDGVAVPAGVLVLPSSVSDAERQRIDDEWNAQHSQRRKTAVVRGEPGSVQWVNAGLNPMDADFINGRKLNRQAIYEALELPLGVMSEASTEAHARVAERQQLHAAWRQHFRVASKLNSLPGSTIRTIAPMQYFPDWDKWLARPVDVRLEAADWDQMSKKLAALDRYLSADEIRTSELGLQPLGAARPAMVEREAVKNVSTST